MTLTNKKLLLLLFLILSTLILLKIKNKAIYIQDNSSTKNHQEIRVIDGDTFVLNNKKIRLYGIDAPEKNQYCYKKNKNYPCGKLSTEYLDFLLTGEEVSCQEKSIDRYNRAISICYINQNDIGKLMVRQGWAVAYDKYSRLYSNDQTFAQENKFGIWSKSFSTPENYRKDKK